MLDFWAEWKSELQPILNEIDRHKEYLAYDRAFELERALIYSSAICRCMFDRAREDWSGIKAGNCTHFDPDLAKKINTYGEKKIALSGCIGTGFLPLPEHKTTVRTICNQIIHASALQLWKSPDPSNPSFFVGSKKALGEKNCIFLHVTWDQYRDIISQFVDIPSGGSR